VFGGGVLLFRVAFALSFEFGVIVRFWFGVVGTVGVFVFLLGRCV
jgi:hypothetical protein